MLSSGIWNRSIRIQRSDVAFGKDYSELYKKSEVAIADTFLFLADAERWKQKAEFDSTQSYFELPLKILAVPHLRHPSKILTKPFMKIV